MRDPEIQESIRTVMGLPDDWVQDEPLLKDTQLLPTVFEAFEQHRKGGISFTDAALLVMMQALGIDWLGTFDKDLRRLARSLTS